ncbi:TetR family transcriptional regulator [Haloactinopolyspora alba]|uniref:TetR family transcriptional regulator n=1 Tax=Haloactinopolyspora alba TaxID=648780 RepID=A0A2P8DWQ2_9ACTN|nr:TetR/AcrR family transcriptional regulator [Haloactinopolyspora alba]PSL01651.1 TetR family transcriptional regulator [Haloactinopolyspora alba]
MATTRAATDTGRAPLTRDRILRAALNYVDEHGLESLSMHKLGAELGVKGMSLYNHVAGKDDVLDGVVETLWTEVEDAAPPDPDWHRGYRQFAHALRDVLHQHPNAAPLITARQVMPIPALRAVRAHITAAVDSGVAEDRAYELLRTLTSYALGHALAYLSWGLGCPGCVPSVRDLLRPGTPDDLAGVADVFCGQSDPDAQFELGLDLMIRGSS